MDGFEPAPSHVEMYKMLIRAEDRESLALHMAEQLDRFRELPKILEKAIVPLDAKKMGMPLAAVAERWILQGK